MESEMLELHVDIRVRQPNRYGGDLQLSESIQLSSRSFFDLCKILGEFQDLTMRIKAREPQQ